MPELIHRDRVCVGVEQRLIKCTEITVSLSVFLGPMQNGGESQQLSKHKQFIRINI